MKIWLDDEREPPDKSWTWAKNSYEAFSAFFENPEKIEEISFDHDLGKDDTSIPVATYLEKLAYFGIYAPIKWVIHSMNPVGRKNLQAILERADEYWEKKKDG